MKKTLLKILTAVAAALMPWPLAAVNTIIHTAYYNGNSTIGTDTIGGGTYATVHYDGLYNGGTPGTPSLPIDYIRFSVPYNATNFTVTAQPKNTYSSRLNYPIYPCQEPRMMNDTTPVVITLPDSAAYYSGNDYPTQRAWIVDEGFLAGENHVITVAVMPIAYKYSATGLYRHTLKESHSVRLTLSYSLSDSLAMYPIVRNDSTLRAEGYALTQRMVANPSNVIANAPIEMTMDSLIFINPNQGDGLNGGGIPPYHPDPGDEIPDTDSTFVNGGELQPANYCPYLIVTTSDLEHSVRRIAALKRQKGYNVKVVTMDEVLNSPFSSDGDRIRQSNGTYLTTFTDNAGKLRQFLRTYYANFGAQYVFLIGRGVPFRYSTWPPKAPCDMYFSDFHTNYRTQNYDNKPEVYTGRLLANSYSQINNYTDKLFRYELNPGRGDYSYLKRSIWTEAVDLIGETDTIRQTLTNIYSDTVIREESGHKRPKGSDVISELNTTQYGFMSFNNHGEPSAIAVYGVDTRNNSNRAYDNWINWIWAVDTVHVSTSGLQNCDTINNALKLMTNKWMPNILYSIACSTMPFDTINGYENIPMNFGESFTTGKDYGGPAFLGNTRAGMRTYSSELENEFAKQIVEGFYKLGEAEAISKMKYSLNQVNTVHNLLGDPEFELWTDIPQQYSNISITRSDNSISISGISSDSTIVAVYNNGGQMGKTIVRDTDISLNANPNSTIMLYKHNYIPYIAPLELQNITFSKNQYVIANDVIAGKFVNINRTPGNVVVKSGIEYEIESSGTVTLQDGFSVEKGATFAVYPSSF